MPIKKIAILFSGSGTNLENLLKKLHNKEFNGFKIEVAVTICNNPNAMGIMRSKKYGIEPIIINHKDFASREDFDKELVATIKEREVQLTVLAGFMRFLTPVFITNIKAINLHPSILPLFKGRHAIEESFKSGMKVGGITVHHVSKELDGGTIIAQRCFQKNTNMSLNDYEKRIHNLEYELLPSVVVDILSEINP